jgi:CspA family cold shock protein
MEEGKRRGPRRVPAAASIMAVWQLAQSTGIEMATGTVKWFNDARGFGFITPDDGSEDLCAHFSEVRAEGFDSLQEKQKVSFDVKTGPKGKQAANIKPL